MTAILIATRNSHKAREIGSILGQAYRYLTLSDFTGSPVTVEDAATFDGNARKKAAAVSQWITENPLMALGKELTPAAPFYVLADDSGLEVDALNGAPGVHSARFAAMDISGTANSPDTANTAKLLRLLESIPDEKRKARFRCVLAVTRLLFSEMTKRVLPGSQNQSRIFEGTCEGRIARSPMGDGGFGYDPVFIPDGFTQSFGSLGEDEKNRLSHRARALQKLREYFAAKT